MYNATISVNNRILITGGTSGLGFELVRQFLDRGFFVVATGRQSVELPGFEDRFRLYKNDFCNLSETAGVFKEICNSFDFGYVINNAGILSPQDFKATADGFEYTFQVNFLAHFLINEIIIRNHDPARPLKIAAITSPVYRIASFDLNYIREKKEYKPLRAYSDSKLYLALMCRNYAVRYQNGNTSFLAFDPGIFGSRIYRMQPGFFQFLYGIGALFMRKPASVARVLAELITESGTVSGEVYDLKKKIRKFPEIESSVSEAFWEKMDQITAFFI